MGKIEGGFVVSQLRINIVQYHPKYADQTVEMWRNSKERAIGQKESHSLESHIYFLNQILPKRYHIDLALLEENVVGMIAYNNAEISQLYVHIHYQRKGIGELLINKVKGQSNGELTLHTFEINKVAQQFYNKNGFKIVGRGAENEENLPDIKYEWKRK